MNSFWRGRRVLVTGHTGFKGSWLAWWLQRCSSVVSGLALAPETAPALFSVADVGAGMTSVLGDVRSAEDVEKAFALARPSVVFHLAAQPLVRASYDAPVETYETNVMGTLHVLEAARRYKADAVVVITTDKCYENQEWPWGYRENDRLGGHDPYSASKACVELMCDSYRKSFCATGAGPWIATARAGNVIGGGDWAADRLIPDVIRALSEERPVVLRNPLAVRPWQHVLEPLGGYLLLAERLVCDGESVACAWNFGPAYEDCRSVKEVVGALCVAWGSGVSWELEAQAQPHETQLLRLDSSKANALLGWRPRWSLGEALSLTAQLYRAYYRGDPVQTLMSEQIAQYESLPHPD